VHTIRYYSNRELSEKLKINHAKWKRWSREFLPPDPLGGLQSGYARQYSPADAFTVYLGGHLIADLKFAIPECRRIMGDLHGWLVRKGFLFDPVQPDPGCKDDRLIKGYQILILQELPPESGGLDFRYLVRGFIAAEPARFEGASVMQEFYTETAIPENRPIPRPHTWQRPRLLNISSVRSRFTAALNLEIS